MKCNPVTVQPVTSYHLHQLPVIPVSIATYIDLRFAFVFNSCRLGGVLLGVRIFTPPPPFLPPPHTFTPLPFYPRLLTPTFLAQNKLEPI